MGVREALWGERRAAIDTLCFCYRGPHAGASPHGVVLRAGASPEEIRETILQAAVFLGFPRALGAMRLFRKAYGPPHPGEG